MPNSQNEAGPADFQDKTVLVVGGSSGIGNGIAQSFRKHGAHVYVWGTRLRGEDYTDSDSNLEGLDYSCVDVSDHRAIESYQPEFSSLDVLVLSQGLVLYNREEFLEPGWSKVLDVNLRSLMHCASKFRNYLLGVSGSLIIINSIAGFTATRGNPAYSASKSGAIGLTKSLAEAWAEDGIRVNGVAPGFVDTKLTSVTTDNPKRLQATLQAIPLHRLGTPEDIANCVLFLASNKASYIVGETIVVDGGLTLS